MKVLEAVCIRLHKPDLCKQKKQEKIYVEIIHPLAKLKEETVEYPEKISRELEDGKYIVDDEMENVYKLPIDGGESSKA